MYKTISRMLMILPLIGLLAIPNAAMAQLSLSVSEDGVPPSGYKTYDFFADITTNMGPMELMLETYHAGDIYQNATAANNPNEGYASYVTIGSSGANPAQTSIYGGAVDLGGGASATFDSSTIDIAWGPNPGIDTGDGQRQIARVTLDENAAASWTLTGWQDGDNNPAMLSGTIAAPPMTLSLVEVAGAPAGYQSYDFFADVKTDMGPMELLLTTTKPGDIYQNSLTPEDAAEDYDTYVTTGPSGENPAQTSIYGGAVDLGGAAVVTFDDQNIDIAWGLDPGDDSGRGLFQIARVTLKDGTVASYDLIGWQIDDNTEISLSGEISLLLPGDVNEDLFVGGADLTTVVDNWGLVNVERNRGDLDRDGVVGAADYTEVINNWGNGTPPEPPSEPIPEPATLALLVLGGLALLKRRSQGKMEKLRRHYFRYPNRIVCVCVLAALLALTSGPRVGLAIGSGDAGFGKMWTHSNPFVIMGTSPVYQDDPNGAPTYWGANHTYMNATESESLVQGWTEPYGGKPWIRKRDWTGFGSTDPAYVLQQLAVPNLQAWSIEDEPDHDEITALGPVAAGIRGITRDQLVYVHMDDVAEYDHLFTMVNPDVLQCGHYPFRADGSTVIGLYMDNMMTMRSEALTRNVPYWGYIQSFAYDTYRVSSESDMRMNVYSRLTSGYTGIQYYTHVRWSGSDGALLDLNGQPDTMYWFAQDVNAEVQNLGQALRLLESTDVRWIGSGLGGDDSTPTTNPSDLPDWSSDAGGDTHITNVAIDGGQAGAGYKNGMIGFFEDYVGGKHFMLNNLDHAAGTSAAAASLDFTITFDSSVNSLLRLNRETGVQEVVALTNHQLSTTLPGGTADLYKYNTNDFLLEQPQMILELVEVTDPGAPVGYTAYDVMATTSTNLGTMELVLDADAANDIYHSVTQDPDTPDGAFDTYVTMPLTFSVSGPAVDIDPLASQVWDDDELNVAWTPAGGENSFPGAYQIARIVLKNSASGTYTVKGWQTGGWAAVELSASFGMAGDVNGDGFVGGGDLNAILSNWGLAGARRSQGDLTGEGDVGGADYNQVLGNWGAGTPPEPPGAIPEPGSIALLLVSSLVLSGGRRRMAK